LLDTLLVLVLAAHLLAANLAGAAPLVCIWLDVRETRRSDLLAGELGRYLIRQSIVWLTAGLALGGSTLAVVWAAQWEPFYETASRIPAARFWWAVPELAFYFYCVAMYLRWWAGPGTSAAWRVVMRRVLGVLAATSLLYHFPLLFTVIGVYSTRVAVDPGMLNFRRAMLDPEVLSQFAHHVLASFAIVGVAIMGFSLRLGRQGRPAEEVQRVATWGGRVALVPTVLQLVVGMLVLLALPARARDGLLGGDNVGTLLFGLSIVAAIVLMHRLASIAAGDVERKNLIGSMALLVLIVVAMVGTRQRARQGKFVSTAVRIERAVAAIETPSSLAVVRQPHGGDAARTMPEGLLNYKTKNDAYPASTWGTKC
jgi:hypothetical protein